MKEEEKKKRTEEKRRREEGRSDVTQMAEHPTVKRYEEAKAVPRAGGAGKLDPHWLRQLAMEAGAEDVGFVEIRRSELDEQRADILAVYPWTKSLISLVGKMNRGPIRSVARSVANLEFHHTTDELDEAARRIVSALEERGIRAVNPSAGFPMEMDRFPSGKTFVVSHKPVAVAAGLGRMGIHRNVIHPRFGSFVLLATVLTEAEIGEYSRPIEYNPCLECKLCVAACPTGAIAADGRFDFSACYTHNYREFMGGFTDWVEQIAESKDARDYRKRVSDPESASMWQSLSFGANYKAAYCLAVCPAGEEVIGPFLENRKEFLEEVVKPLQEKRETVYVIPGSDAEGHVARRFKNKTVKRVGNGLRPSSIASFLRGLRLTFQPGQAQGLEATYHFAFTGREARNATIAIREGTLKIEDGHNGTADLRVTADSETWLGYLRKERSLIWALLTRKIRIRGPVRLMRAFGKCFPS